MILLRTNASSKSLQSVGCIVFSGPLLMKTFYLSQFRGNFSQMEQDAATDWLVVKKVRPAGRARVKHISMKLTFLFFDAFIVNLFLGEEIWFTNVEHLKIFFNFNLMDEETITCLVKHKVMTVKQYFVKEDVEKYKSASEIYRVQK